MDWLFQGIIVNAIWLIIMAISKIFSKINESQNNFNELTIKIHFHIHLLILLFAVALTFHKIPVLLTEKKYLSFLLIVFSYFIGYLFTLDEFNNAFNRSKNNKFNKKQQSPKNKSK